MPSQGWQRTDQRACEPQSPAILCLSPDSEGPYELRVAERVLLPGECIEAPSPDAQGRLRVAFYASGQVVGRPRVRVRAGVRTEVAIGDERGRPRLDTVEQQRCDGRVPGP